MHQNQGAPLALGFPRVAMIGGGQLARMTGEAASALGAGLRVLAGGPSDSAARAGGDVWFGAHDDPVAVAAFARGCEVVTFDHEHVPTPILADLVASGISVHPSPAALIHAQDKLEMRACLTAAGIPCPAWAEVVGVEDVLGFGDSHSWPVVLKVARGGYDGRGVWVVERGDVASVIEAARAASAGRLLVEEFVSFTGELAAQVARSASGQTVSYPVVRTVQTGGICTEVVAPAPGLSQERASAASQIAVSVAQALDVVGMLAVELFDTPGGVLVNELAMRPHNSGHWTIEGALTSQFENHLRAVLDLPLGSTATTAPFTVMVNVLGGSRTDLYSAFGAVMSADPELHIHMYGKDARPGRKLGHVTVSGDDLDELLARAHWAADYLTGDNDG